jgi:5-(carboxyamino)imidazole ribonucleotide synthase
MTTAPILPPAMLGVLGGGQLGRYFVMAARTMGYRTMVLEPDPSAPAGAVADVHLIANYDDPTALASMAAQCAVVTTEFENPPAHALAQLAKETLVRPSPAAIEITQDRRAEKYFLTQAGVPVAPYVVIETDDDIANCGVTLPAILKTARMGYDGKGQVVVRNQGELEAAWRQLNRVACVLEQKLPLDAEVSVVLARGVDGATAVFPTAGNVHVDGILDVTTVPVDAPGANDLALAIAMALDYVGVLAVEMFVVDGRLIVNELAPRPHNSGHWTLDAAATSQFEQQVRAVCGLPLGDPSLMAPAVAMANLLGDVWDQGQPNWHAALAEPGAHLHLYGKLEPRPGRKMGHLTVLAPTTSQATTRALALRQSARNE